MASRRVAQRGIFLLTLQTSQPFLARSELVNKDLDAALSRNYPGSSALSRVTPGLLLVLCVCAGFRRHQIQFPHSCLGARMGWACRSGSSSRSQPWPLCPHCHLPHVPIFEVATSSSKDKAISASSPGKAHPGHHLRTEFSVSAPTPKNWEKRGKIRSLWISVTLTCCFSHPSPRECSPWRRGGVAGVKMGRGCAHQGQTGQTGSQHCFSWRWGMPHLPPQGGLKTPGKEVMHSKLEDVEETGTKLPEFCLWGESGCYPQSFSSLRISRCSRSPLGDAAAV